MRESTPAPAPSSLDEFDREADRISQIEERREAHRRRTAAILAQKADGPRCQECGYRLMRRGVPWQPAWPVVLEGTYRTEEVFRERLASGKSRPPYEKVRCRKCGLSHVFKRVPPK